MRRQLLEILAERELSAGELSDRRRIYRLTAEPLAQLDQWLQPFEKFWRARLAVLAKTAQELK
ncbi:transcriptional regulator [Mycobacterium shigaense]|uniref:Transcriptional regulator n=1 Tax=Mycobacterium shigaense TaxID=722731 RepID=A0A1Z4EIP1_9MYCO|nr:hypothetical protein B2J96_18870 [Mycobacterium shigaense]BAX92849.1 transcriptional regulator [Mycobacterium shigaense]